jgi:hypothetical protein
MRKITGAIALFFITTIAQAQTTAIKAGRLIDPETGTATANQVILIEGVMMPEKFFHPGPVRTPNGRWTR